MTRREFLDSAIDWRELIDFCYEQSIDFCDDVYSEERKDEWYNDYIYDMARNANGWRDLRSLIEEIPDGYDYYIKDDYDDFRAADDDDFRSHVDDILSYMDDGEYWDEEDDSDEYDSEEDIDYEVQENDSSSLAELFTICNNDLQKLNCDREAKEIFRAREEEESFRKFCDEIGVSVSNTVFGGMK